MTKIKIKKKKKKVSQPCHIFTFILNNEANEKVVLKQFQLLNFEMLKVLKYNSNLEV